MPIGFRICVSLALLIAASPHLLRAQFQQPTPEELSMTADPKAPGAAAVYLYREETTDDNLHFHSYYERIKVLSEKGKELATVRIPFERTAFKVTDIKGRTIHPDGTVIPLTAKPSDLIDFKSKSMQVDTMVFTLPDVEVGSILEYRLQLRYDDNTVSSPNWAVQQPYFVHKAHYFFVPNTRGGSITNSRGDLLDKLMYGVRANGTAKVIRDASGRYSFDIADVPPIPNEEWMPPLNSLNWRVEFYYTSVMSGSEFWQSAGKRWVKETDRFASEGKGIKQAAAELITPADTDEQKAHKIYDAVMKLENTSFSREKSAAERKNEKLRDIKDAESVWNQKGGSANEIALLFVAMARAAGLQAYPMQVVNRDSAIFDSNYLSSYQLDDYIAIVSINGKEVYVDPGQKMCPFGLLHWKHTMAGGLRLSSSGPVFSVTPATPYTQDTVIRVADLTIAPDGSITGTLRFVLSGQDALHWRQLALENDQEEVKKQFNESLREEVPDGAQADFDHFIGLDDGNINLIGSVKVTGSIGTSTGKRYFLPGQFFESRARHPFVAQDKRTTPIDVHYARHVMDDVTYHLPPGFSIESGPQATAIPWANRATLKIDSKADQGTAEVVRNFAYNFTILGADDYQSLHDFYQKVAAADQQQLVLTASAPAKGN